MRKQFFEYTTYGRAVSEMDKPLLRAMADGVTELEIEKTDFIKVMRYATANRVYQQVFLNEETYPTVYGIKLVVTDDKE